tara:strand:+ start:3127 stop:3768 length:642 start_codon:yes stop_codon:yes gene_type:complete
MDTTTIAAVTAAAAFFGGAVVYYLTRDAQSDLIIYDDDLRSMGLLHARREVAEIFLLKNEDRRILFAKNEFAKAEETKEVYDEQMIELEDDIERLNDSLNPIIETISGQDSQGQEEIMSQAKFTRPFMKLTDHLARLSTILNAYVFECSKSRFFEMVKQGYEKDAVIENMVDKNRGQDVIDTKFSAFLKAQMKSMELKMSTQDKIKDRFLSEK